MSQDQKAIYQERAELCLQAARNADKVAAQLYKQIQAEETPDPSVYDHWLEMVASSAFWTREWLAYLDMIKGLKTETKILFVNDESSDELTAEELAMSGAEFLASHPTKVSESVEEVDEEMSIRTVTFNDGTSTKSIIWK